MKSSIYSVPVSAMLPIGIGIKSLAFKLGCIFALAIIFMAMPGCVMGDQSVMQAGDSANVRDFGAKGDGITDDTEAFKAAIATGLPVYVPGTEACYMISDSLYLQNSISFADHAKLKFKVDFSIKHQCYRWKDILVVENKINQNTLYINNPQIDGGWAYGGCPLNWGDSGFYTGDNGHAIKIKSSTNVKVIGGRLENLGGAGISCHIAPGVSPSAENYSPDNIYVDGTIIDNPNGCVFSLEAGTNCTFKNIKGYKHNNFVAAIDVEPNTKWPNATIDDLVIDNCYIVSDGSDTSNEPISQYGLSLDGKAEPLEINCCSTAGHKWGDILVKNSTFIAKNCFAAKCSGKFEFKYFTRSLTFDNCEFQSNYGAFSLWGGNYVALKNCVADLSAEVYRHSIISSLADSSGAYKCVVDIDNLQYNCLGDSQVDLYQIGKATVKSSKIDIKSISPDAFELYSALYFNKCQEARVENCYLKSMRNAVDLNGPNTFQILNNTLAPNVGSNPRHFCIWAGSKENFAYNIDGNVYDTSVPGTEKLHIKQAKEQA